MHADGKDKHTIGTNEICESYIGGSSLQADLIRIVLAN